MRAASAGASTSAAISSPGLPACRAEPASPGLIDQQVAAHQVHPRAGAGDPVVQARLDCLDRPPAGVDLIARARSDREGEKPERVEGHEVLDPWLRLVTDAHLGALEPGVGLSHL